MKTVTITKWPNGFPMDGVMLKTTSECGRYVFEKTYGRDPSSNERHVHDSEARNAFDGFKK